MPVYTVDEPNYNQYWRAEILSTIFDPYSPKRKSYMNIPDIILIKVGLIFKGKHKWRYLIVSQPSASWTEWS